MIQEVVKKYIPSSLMQYVSSADRFERDGGFRYNVEMNIDGEEVSIFADSATGLTWALRQVKNGIRGVIYG